MNSFDIVCRDFSDLFNYYSSERERVDETGILGETAFYPVVNETLAVAKIIITAPSMSETPDDFFDDVVRLCFSPVVVAASVAGAAKYSKIALGILAAAYLGTVYLRTGQNPEGNLQ